MEKRPAGVSQFGGAYGNHSIYAPHGKTLDGAIEDVRGNRKPIGGELGNAVAEQTKCGPGGSRVLYGQSGTQGKH